jgi:hypothetical protein
LVSVVATVSATDVLNNRPPFDETGRSVSIVATVTATDTTDETIWSADSETGDVSQWQGVSISGNGTAEASTEESHTGTYSIKCTAVGLAGIRLRVQDNFAPDPENLPNSAIYSAWYYIPFTEMLTNVFQFKQADIDRPGHQTRRLLMGVTAEWNGSAYDLRLKTRLRQDSGMWIAGTMDTLQYENVDLPIDTWFQLKMLYVWGQDLTGRMKMWLDDEVLWDMQNVSTEANNLTYIEKPRQWTANHYISDYGNDNDRTTWLYIDDAKITI